jgi:hypothetical protein
MKRTAKIFAWIALVYGVPPMLVCILWLFEGGWRMFLYLGLTALPPLPLILTQDSTAWRTPPPVVPLALAIGSLVISTLVYRNFFGFRIGFFQPH